MLKEESETEKSCTMITHKFHLNTLLQVMIQTITTQHDTFGTQT